MQISCKLQFEASFERIVHVSTETNRRCNIFLASEFVLMSKLRRRRDPFPTLSSFSCTKFCKFLSSLLLFMFLYYIHVCISFFMYVETIFFFLLIISLKLVVKIFISSILSFLAFQTNSHFQICVTIYLKHLNHPQSSIK